jgi:hypothetical protein
LTSRRRRSRVEQHVVSRASTMWLSAQCELLLGIHLPNFLFSYLALPHMQSYYYRNEDLEAELTLPIFFTPKQANEFLPQVRETVQQVISIKRETDSLKDDNEMTGAMERLERKFKNLRS